MASSPVTISPSDSKLVWRKMNKQELRDALASRGLDTTGLRPSLIQRLESSCKSASAAVDTETSFKSSGEKLLPIPQNGTVDYTETQTPSVADVPNVSEVKEPNLAMDDVLDASVASMAPNQASDAHMDSRKRESNGSGASSTVLDASVASMAPNQASDAHMDSRKRESNGSGASSMMPASETKNAYVDNRKCELNGSGASSIASLSDLDKKRKRAERFGVGLNVSDEERLALRSQRFSGGQSESKVNVQQSESEKRKQRAARFGIIDEATKKRVRQERFGATNEHIESENAKRKARAERFEATTKEDNLKAKVT